MNNLPLVSIIIPVFNAEATLVRTLVALKSQSYPAVELVFVNDASTDKSLAMLTSFANAMAGVKDITVKIVSHTENCGVSAARNTGLAHAEGEFIAYVDADDIIDENAIALCVNRAAEDNADIVYFQWWLSFSKKQRKMVQPICRTPKEAIRAMLAGRMRWNLWLFFVRRSLYERNAIRFVPGANMGEDLLVTISLLIHAKKMVLIDKPLYHYKQDNTESISKTYSAKHIHEVETNIRETEHCLKNSLYAELVDPGIHFLKLNIKLPLLTTGKKSDYIRWTKWFTSSDEYILRNRQLPLRTRAVQWLAWKRQYWLIWLYNVLVLRVIYGRIFK